MERECNTIKPETDGVLFFLHVMSCSDCQKRYTVFYAQQLALSCPTLTDRDKLILAKSFAAFEMQKYVASREWMGLTNEVRLLRSRANVNFRAGEICERRRLAVIKDDEERELRRARSLLLKSKQPKADNAVQDADTEPEDNV